jgi:hypothetical protein
MVNFLLHPENFASNKLYLGIIGITVILGTVGAVSLFTGSSFKIDFVVLSTVGVITFLLAFLNELLAIFNALAVGGTGARIFAVLLMSPMFIMYMMIVIEWWRGVN